MTFPFDELQRTWKTSKWFWIILKHSKSINWCSESESIKCFCTFCHFSCNWSFPWNVIKLCHFATFPKLEKSDGSEIHGTELSERREIVSEFLEVAPFWTTKKIKKRFQLTQPLHSKVDQLQDYPDLFIQYISIPWIVIVIHQETLEDFHFVIESQV